MPAHSCLSHQLLSASPPSGSKASSRKQCLEDVPSSCLCCRVALPNSPWPCMQEHFIENARPTVLGQGTFGIVTRRDLVVDDEDDGYMIPVAVKRPTVSHLKPEPPSPSCCLPYCLCDLLLAILTCLMLQSSQDISQFLPIVA